jgi:thiamine pyrophosphokinase
MSSHHIVREAQEPALFLYTIDSTLPEYVNDLLEWSPVVICTENSLFVALQHGVKIDVVICPTSFVSTAETLTAHQQPIRIVAHEQIALIATLEYLVENKHSAVNICSTIPINPDELLTFTSTLTIVVMDMKGNKSFWAMPPSFTKWLPQGQLLSITPAPVATDNNLKINAEGYLEVEQTGTLLLHLSSPTWVELVL